MVMPTADVDADVSARLVLLMLIVDARLLIDVRVLVPTFWCGCYDADVSMFTFR